MLIGTTLQRSASNIATSQSLFRNAFVQELLFKDDTKRSLRITIRDYTKLARKCPPGVCAPPTAVFMEFFPLPVFASRHPLYFFSSGHYKTIQPLLTDSSLILGYLALLLPPTFVDFASACVPIIAEQMPKTHSGSPLQRLSSA